MAKLKTLKQRMAEGSMPPPVEFENHEDAIKAYESGYEGCIFDPDGAEECEAQEDGVFGDAAHKYGIAGSGQGKLSLLYPACWKVSGRDGWFHGARSQPTGDCVSRGQSHAAIASLANAVLNGNGSWPEIPEEAYRSGMPWSPTGTYWLKKSGPSGWSCAAAARESKKIGLVIGKHYESVGDLLKPENYTTNTISKYCRSGPPEAAFNELNYSVTQTYSRIKSLDEVLDAIANGYGVNSCGGEGFSKTRDANGVSRRSGHWSHSMAYIAADATEWAHKNYGGPLILVLNSWGTSWIHGPRKVQGGEDYPEIPKGSFWAKWADLSGRDCYAFSAVKGFPPQKLPDWRLRDLI